MKKYGLIVVGGGLTGVAAAISAARQGVSALLIEESGSLGGAISNNLVFPFMSYRTKVNDDPIEYRLLSSGIISELLEYQRSLASEKYDGSLLFFMTEYFKCALDTKLLESGAELLLHTKLCGVRTENGKVTAVTVATKSGLTDISADFFIDATGDGDLFAFAGCDYQLGREKDNLCQPMTTCFRLCNVDNEAYKGEKAKIQELYKQFRAENKIDNPRENILLFYMRDGIFNFNSTRVVKLDPTNPADLTKAEIKAREQMLELVDFLRNNTVAFKNSVLISSAASIGVRESRKLKGEHILTAEELKNCTKFEDSIALGNYDIDIHNPEGSGTSHYLFKDGQYYTIPYRSLLPKEYDNLLVAGRCISATHEAQASIRIMPICCCLGQAAGTAAAVAFKTNKTAKTVDVDVVREKLRKDGAQVD